MAKNVSTINFLMGILKRFTSRKIYPLMTCSGEKHLFATKCVPFNSAFPFQWWSVYEVNNKKQNLQEIKVTLLNFWARSLTDEEIRKMTYSCEKPAEVNKTGTHQTSYWTQTHVQLVPFSVKTSFLTGTQSLRRSLTLQNMCWIMEVLKICAKWLVMWHGSWQCL